MIVLAISSAIDFRLTRQLVFFVVVSLFEFFIYWSKTANAQKHNLQALNKNPKHIRLFGDREHFKS